ncbi:MAG: polysaccharide pyruvyl transferase family protein [Planctomycetes bacterium]|nr:polysaccharide pyruvyl transferase family protein [Planctomycetota bacterium]
MIGVNYARNLALGTRGIARGAWTLLREEKLGQVVPPLPTVLQFPVNDICNSRCGMCNIWQRKRDHEITPDELRKVLGDRLYSRVKYVGLSGGEPTLRKDLPELGQALIDGLPKLRGIGIITNAVRSNDVIDRITALCEVVRAADKRFEVNISLDGVGADHDRNRGIVGNFDSAVYVIDILRQREVPVLIGCTLTPTNAHGADDLLAWCEARGLDRFEFRLGVENNRLYNEGFNLLNPFTPEQRFHLTMLFDKLAHHPRVDSARRRFYRSLSDQLAFTAQRTAGCAWKARGVTLDTRGNVSYCSVKSPVLGSAILQSGWAIFKSNIAQRREIVKNECGDCQHDLLGPPPAKAQIREGLDLITKPWSDRFAALRKHATLNPRPWNRAIKSRPADRPHPSQWRHVLVTGWYGTETAGDKAILGEVLHFIRSQSPECRVTLSTINRKISGQTAREMDELRGVGETVLSHAYDPASIESVDAVIIGGGPLEEIGQTEHLWRIFKEANRQNKARVIFGCGVGPFHTDRVRSMVASILRLTTAGFLRDVESYDLARRLTDDEVILPVGCDPAMAYLKRWADSHGLGRADSASVLLATLLRANTREYVSQTTDPALASMNDRSARSFAAVLDRITARTPVNIDMLPMHAVWVGGDDRLFNRAVRDAMTLPAAAAVERGYLNLHQVLRRLARADVSLAMRYHGHLFSMALGVPFLSIDYTGRNGKVAALVRRMGYERWSLDWNNVDADAATDKLTHLIAERDQWSAHLKSQTDRLLAELDNAYAQAFGVTPRPQRRAAA